MSGMFNKILYRMKYLTEDQLGYSIVSCASWAALHVATAAAAALRILNKRQRHLHQYTLHNGKIWNRLTILNHSRITSNPLGLRRSSLPQSQPTLQATQRLSVCLLIRALEFSYYFAIRVTEFRNQYCQPMFRTGPTRMLGFNLPGHAMLIWHVPIRAWLRVVK